MPSRARWSPLALPGLTANMGQACRGEACWRAPISKRLAKRAKRKPACSRTSSFSASFLSFSWLGSRDSNPNYLIQSQASYR